MKTEKSQRNTYDAMFFSSVAHMRSNSVEAAAKFKQRKRTKKSDSLKKQAIREGKELYQTHRKTGVWKRPRGEN
jgi:hypothetical protein